MLAVGLGLLVAASYGSADFFGGLASRRRSVIVVVLWTQVTGLVALGLFAPLLGGDPDRRDLWLGLLAGLVGVCGVLLLYRGLAGGRMSVVAPITAVGAAFVPFVVGAAGGEGLPASRLAGAVAALAGVALVSRPPARRAGEAPRTGRGQDLALGAGAGAAFGVVFVLLSWLGEDAGVWPVLVQRIGSVPAVLVMTVMAGLPRRVGRLDLRLIVPAGLCDAAANTLFVAASRAGALSVVGVVSSLYPAATVLLAALVLKERVSLHQGVGLLLAGAGVVLLAL